MHALPYLGRSVNSYFFGDARYGHRDPFALPLNVPPIHSWPYGDRTKRPQRGRADNCFHNLNTIHVSNWSVRLTDVRQAVTTPYGAAQEESGTQRYRLPYADNGRTKRWLHGPSGIESALGCDIIFVISHSIQVPVTTNVRRCIR